jgi:uncharacterized protein YndB with AHSA1/START domain
VQVSVRRSYDVPAQQIYDAWTRPEQIREWLTLGGTYEGSAQVGGKYQLNMLHDGKLKEHSGSYLRLEPPHLIEFSWFSPHGTYGRETIVRIEITDLGSACEMVLTHMKLPEDTAQGHQEGWTRFGDILAKQVGSA